MLEVEFQLPTALKVLVAEEADVLALVESFELPARLLVVTVLVTEEADVLVLVESLTVAFISGMVIIKLGTMEIMDMLPLVVMFPQAPLHQPLHFENASHIVWHSSMLLLSLKKPFVRQSFCVTGHPDD